MSWRSAKANQKSAANVSRRRPAVARASTLTRSLVLCSCVCPHSDAGVDLGKPIITSCGSGMTAAILTFALESIGTTAKGLYDGSWTEWGSRPDNPVERE